MLFFWFIKLLTPPSSLLASRELTETTRTPAGNPSEDLGGLKRAESEPGGQRGRGGREGLPANPVHGQPWTGPTFHAGNGEALAGL